MKDITKNLNMSDFLKEDSLDSNVLPTKHRSNDYNHNYPKPYNPGYDIVPVPPLSLWEKFRHWLK